MWCSEEGGGRESAVVAGAFMFSFLNMDVNSRGASKYG